MLAITSVLAAILYAPIDQITQSTSATFVPLWVTNFFFSWSDLGYFQQDSSTNLFLHTWSLGVEEQFYLIWPLIILGIVSKASDLKSLLKALGLICIFSFAISIYWLFVEPEFSFYLMPSRAWQFSIGALTYLASINRQQYHFLKSKKYSQAISAIAFVSILLATYFYSDQMSYPGLPAIVPTLGTVFLLLFLDSNSSFLSKVFTNKYTVFIGDISYSWYLWHWPILLLGKQLHFPENTFSSLTFVGISLVIAILAYYTVEKPLRKISFLTRKPVAMIALGLSVMTISCIGVIGWKNFAFDKSQSPEQQEFANLRYLSSTVYADGCDDWYSSSTIKACGYGDPNAERRAVMIGDSIGLQWFNAFAPKFIDEGWQFIVLTKSSCPIIDEDFYYQRIGEIFTICSEWRRNVIEALPGLNPDLVIIGNAGTYDFSEAQWLEGTRRIVSSVSQSSKQVILLRPTFRLAHDGPGCLAQKAWQPEFIARLSTCNTIIDVNEDQKVHQALITVAAEFPNTELIDLNFLNCPQNECLATKNGVAVYRDFQHLSPEYVKTIKEDVWKEVYQVLQ